MGDVRFLRPYVRVRDAASPHVTIHALTDREVVEALAAASMEHDEYLANVLATEAQNRLAKGERLAAELARYRGRLEEKVQERTRRLRASNAELEAFAYRVSHDLKAHLRAIEFSARVLEEDFPDELGDGAGSDAVDRLRAESARLTHLVTDLLNFSRAGFEEPAREWVDLSGMAREVLDKLRAESPERRAVIHVEDDLVVDADPRLLRSILENLLGNAWKYVSREGEVRVNVGAEAIDGDGIAFFVRDNGVGFRAEDTSRLFHPFERLHGALFEGTGVGLATVRRVAEAHGGRVWASSPGPGRGATFAFTLK